MCKYILQYQPSKKYSIEREKHLLVLMEKLRLNLVLKQKKDSSPIQVYHNRQFPLNDLLDIFYPLFHADYPDNFLIHMIRTANHIFCAYDPSDRHPIACALVNNTGRQGLYLMLFGVRKSSQHHGVGTKLLERIIEWARFYQYTFIYLHVNAGNYKAIGLYKKLGFRQHEYLPNYYKDSPKENPDGIRMILSLQ